MVGVLCFFVKILYTNVEIIDNQAFIVRIVKGQILSVFTRIVRLTQGFWLLLSNFTRIIRLVIDYQQYLRPLIQFHFHCYPINTFMVNYLRLLFYNKMDVYPYLLKQIIHNNYFELP